MFVSRLKTAQRGWRCAVQTAVLLVVALVPLAPARADAAPDAAFAGHSMAAFVPEQSVQAQVAVSTSVTPDALGTLPRPASPAVTFAPTATTTFTGTASVYTLSMEPVERLLPRATRISHTATLLPNGKVLVVGGEGGDALASAELYDPGSGTWTTTGSLHEGRFEHTATLLDDGKVLVVGGYGRAHTALGSAEVYDPTTGTWTTTGSLQNAHSRHTATLLDDGRVLVVGGYNGTAVASAEVYDPASGTWIPTGSLHKARAYHTATLLPDGKVLVVGGYYNRSYLASAEVYDPGSGTWISIGSLQSARYDHTATLLPNGRVLVAGGDAGTSLASAEEYDPATGTWTATGSLREARWGHTATLLDDGRVLFSGGSWALASAELYDPGSETWTPTGSLTDGRYDHTATLLDDGKVLVVGGRDNNESVASAEVYDLGSGTWTPTGSLTVRRFEHTATLLPDGKVLVVGGHDRNVVESVASAEVYNSATGTWTAAGSLRDARRRHTATVLDDGKVLVVGGVDNNEFVASAEVYDPGSGTWTVTGSLTEGRSDHTATMLDDGKVLVVGGRHNNGSSLASAEVYDPASGTWTPTGSLTEGRSDHTATMLDDGKVLVVGGYRWGRGHLASAEVYDPASGTWTATGSLRAARGYHTATLLTDGKVLVTGGYNGTYLASAEVYDPASRTWTATGSLRVPRHSHTPTLLEDGKVLVVGGAGRGEYLASAELYDPATGTWTATGSLHEGRYRHAATLLDDGRVLFSGGSWTVLAEVGRLETVNTFSGMLTVPAGWTSTHTITFTGDTTDAPLSDAAVNNGPWVPAESTVATTATLPAMPDGAGRPVLLRLRDANGRTADVVTGQIDLDTHTPVSAVRPLAQTSRAEIVLRWSGSDTLSGVAGYDVEVRDGDAGTWTSLLANTTALSTTFTGVQGHTYFFRARAHDGAGNVEAWPNRHDTFTEVDTVAPAVSSLTLNGGARATTSASLNVELQATDTQSRISEMRVRINGAWQAWRPFAPTFSLDLPGADGTKDVAVMVRDGAGNVSEVVAQTIRLDSAAGTDYEMSINDGALWTRIPTVTLRIGAPGGSSAMRVSNDGGFAGAPWQPFDTRPSWTISTFGNYTIPRTVYVRVRDANGTNLTVVTDDIIYDPLPPTGSVTVTATSATAFTVRLGAADQAQLSGVGEMRVSTNPRFTGASWRPYATSATVARDGTASVVYAQFRDRAGNVSTVVSTAPTQPSQHRVFLPSVHR